MVVKHRTKLSRQRGKRWHGWGSKKKHRGAGSRGGRGKAGWMKHKKSFMIKYHPDHFGKTEFKGPKRRLDIITINIRQVEEIAKKNNLKTIDISKLGCNKLLGGGKPTIPLTIKAKMYSKKAKEKVESVGGKIISKEVIEE